MSEETQTATAEVEAVAAPVEAPSVTVNDLVNVYAIIDLASKRGAFQANELQAVGTTASRVKAFVDHVNAQNAAAAATAEVTTEGEPAAPAAAV
jgi:hypothetical protein